jgi:hypothetical protein
MEKSIETIQKQLEEFRQKQNIVSAIVPSDISDEEDSIGREWWISHECFNNISNWDRDLDLDSYYPHMKLIPCSIGTTMFLECPFCKEKKDVTDYKSW